MFETKYKDWWNKLHTVAGDLVPTYQLMPPDYNQACQISFIAGYKQALKDLEQKLLKKS